MKIKKIISQVRRDFEALYVCEHCNHEEEAYGYDDHYFHSEVIPKKVCANCGLISPEAYTPQSTKYQDNQTI